MSCQPDKYLKYTLRNKNKFEDVLTSLKQYFGLPFSLKFGDCIDNSFLSDFPTCKCYQCCFLLIFIARYQLCLRTISCKKLRSIK